MTPRGWEAQRQQPHGQFPKHEEYQPETVLAQDERHIFSEEGANSRVGPRFEEKETLMSSCHSNRFSPYKSCRGRTPEKARPETELLTGPQIAEAVPTATQA